MREPGEKKNDTGEFAFKRAGKRGVGRQLVKGKTDENDGRAAEVFLIFLRADAVAAVRVSGQGQLGEDARGEGVGAVGGRSDDGGGDCREVTGGHSTTNDARFGRVLGDHGFAERHQRGGLEA